MRNTYPKTEKLKSKNTINILFSKGKSVSKYPLRLVYVPINNTTTNSDSDIKIGVSVSKKHFKHAVDRNYFKRVLRETYRLNKQILWGNINHSYAIMFFYQTKERLSYDEINKKTILLFHKFIEEIRVEKNE